eukprot:scaffold3603_cov136-Isochrysis_galbana.AAC.4
MDCPPIPLGRAQAAGTHAQPSVRLVACWTLRRVAGGGWQRTGPALPQRQQLFSALEGDTIFAKTNLASQGAWSEHHITYRPLFCYIDTIYYFFKSYVWLWLWLSTHTCMLPPSSYRPPIATRGPRLATRGRKITRSYRPPTGYLPE